MSKTFIRIDNFLSKEECNKLIEKFKQSKDSVLKYRNTFTVKIKPENILEKINNQFKFHNFLKPDNCEIVMWPVDSYMKIHIDNGDKFSFFLYLNDDFEGGETVVEDITVKPKQGRIIVFSNGVMYHEVKQIKKNNRFMLAGWYN
jgi:hypothetical protein|tara:strand:+ start:571 stop:1005 length:435 start_codon:yes stop_codon:yes gene_type:complete